MNNWSYSNLSSQPNRILTRRRNQRTNPLKVKQGASNTLLNSVKSSKIPHSFGKPNLPENDPRICKFVVHNKTKVLKNEIKGHAYNKSLVGIKSKPSIYPNNGKDNSSVRSITKSYRNDSTAKSLLNDLTEYEKYEILNYTEVYYTGNPNKKLQLTRMKSLHFEDDNGYYKLIPGDHISYRYEIYAALGKGSFGQVCSAYDHKRNKEVAIKILKNNPKIAWHGLSEIKMLEYLRTGHPQVVQILNSFTFRTHICIVLELLQSSLYDLVRYNSFTGVSISLMRTLGSQILCGLKYLREKNIIHCDLKPENIMLVSLRKAEVKLIDFGSSCLSHNKTFTYLQSRYYRAPEIVLGLPYSWSIDM